MNTVTLPDLESHSAALARCRRCRLGRGIRPITSPAVEPRVMLVGQAPGKVESAGGVAFAGRAGKTLFSWLQRAGLDEPTARRKIYIAAVTRCFLGAHPSGRGDRVPTRGEQERCADWLDAELRIIRPKLLIPVGRLAIERFLPKLPLVDLIGTASTITHIGGDSLVIPLPHPSGASSWIHDGDNRVLVDRAIALIADELGRLGLSALN